MITTKTPLSRDDSGTEEEDKEFQENALSSKGALVG